MHENGPDMFSVLKQLRNTPNIFGERLKRISALTIISNFQLLAELAAIHVTDKTSSSFFIRNLKWLVVLLIECTKYVQQSSLFHPTQISDQVDHVH